MTYEQIVETVKKAISKSKAKAADTHIAVEFDIYGEGEGAFYVEINNGAVSVEPYEYYDRDAKVIITGDELIKITNGEKTAHESMDEGILMLEGDENAVNTLFALFVKSIKPKTVKKSAEKKPVEKKAVEKKTAEKKTAEKKTAKSASKPKIAEKAEKAEKKPAAKAEAEKSVKVEKAIVETAKKPDKPIAKDIKK